MAALALKIKQDNLEDLSEVFDLFQVEMKNVPEFNDVDLESDIENYAFSPFNKIGLQIDEVDEQTKDSMKEIEQTW